MQKISFKHKKKEPTTTFLLWDWDKLPRVSWVIFHGDTQNPAGHSLDQPAHSPAPVISTLVDAALSGELYWMVSWGPFQLQSLWSCGPGREKVDTVLQRGERLKENSSIPNWVITLVG